MCVRVCVSRRYERAEKPLSDYEADILRHIDAADDVMAENAAEGAARRALGISAALKHLTSPLIGLMTMEDTTALCSRLSRFINPPSTSSTLYRKYRAIMQRKYLLVAYSKKYNAYLGPRYLLRAYLYVLQAQGLKDPKGLRCTVRLQVLSICWWTAVLCNKL